MRTENTITYFEAIKRAANHFYEAPEMTKYIEDTNAEMRSPEEARNYAFENALQIRILRDERNAVNTTLHNASETREIERAHSRLEVIDSEISFRLKELLSAAELDAYESRYLSKKNMASLIDKIMSAVREGKIAFNLTNGERISAENLTDKKYGKFYPTESMGEFLISGSRHQGLVVTEERAFADWLVAQDIAEGKFDTPQKRKIRSRELYLPLLMSDPPRNLPKKKQYTEFKKVIPGLLWNEFEAVRKSLRSDFPTVSKSGRPPKST